MSERERERGKGEARDQSTSPRRRSSTELTLPANRSEHSVSCNSAQHKRQSATQGSASTAPGQLSGSPTGQPSGSLQGLLHRAREDSASESTASRIGEDTRVSQTGGTVCCQCKRAQNRVPVQASTEQRASASKHRTACQCKQALNRVPVLRPRASPSARHTRGSQGAGAT